MQRITRSAASSIDGAINGARGTGASDATVRPTMMQQTSGPLHHSVCGDSGATTTRVRGTMQRITGPLHCVMMSTVAAAAAHAVERDGSGSGDTSNGARRDGSGGGGASKGA